MIIHIQRRIAWLVLSVAASTAIPGYASPVNIFASSRFVDLEIDQYPDISVDLSGTSSELGLYSELFRASVSDSSVTVNSFVSLDSMVGPDGIFASGTAEAFIELHSFEPGHTSSLVTTSLDVFFEVMEPVAYDLSASVHASFASEPPTDLIANVLLVGPAEFLVGVAVRDGFRSVSESGILEPGIYNLQAGALVQVNTVFDVGFGGSASFEMSLFVPDVSTGLYLALFTCMVALRKAASAKA